MSYLHLAAPVARFQDPNSYWTILAAVDRLAALIGRSSATISIDEAEANTGLLLAQTDLAASACWQQERTLRRALKRLRDTGEELATCALDICLKRDRTLADAEAAVRLARWPEAKKTNALSAIRRVAEAMGHPTAAIPADLGALGDLTRLDLRTKTPGTKRNLLSRFRAAIDLLDFEDRCQRRLAMPADWAQAQAAIAERFPDKEARPPRRDGKPRPPRSVRALSIRPIRTFCIANGIALADVDDAVVRRALENPPKPRRPVRQNRWPRQLQTAVASWNSLARAGLLPRELTPLRFKQISPTIDFSPDGEFGSLHQSWMAYRRRREVGAQGADLSAAARAARVRARQAARAAGDPVLKPLRPQTLDAALDSLKKLIRAFVDAGKRPADLVTLHDVLVPDAFFALMDHYDALPALEDKDKAQQRDNSFNSHFSRLLTLGSALGVQDLETLSAIVQDWRTTGDYERRVIGPLHRKMLRQFDDPLKRRAWFVVPALLVKRAKAALDDERITLPIAIDAMVATAATILRCVPMRAKNLCELRILGPNRTLTLGATGAETRVFVDGDEVKNGVPIDGAFDDTALAAMRFWVEDFRPFFMERVGADPANPHLFPAHGMDSRRPSTMEGVFAERFWEMGELDIDLHVNRHFVARIILGRDLGLMQLVQKILGHRDIATTVKFYQFLDQLDANKSWLKIFSETFDTGSGERRKLEIPLLLMKRK